MMSLNQLSKYLIIFLFSVLVVISILLGIIVAENKALAKDNTRLTEMVALRDKAINEIDLNIKALQEQVSIAESICNDRIKARDDLLVFLNQETSQQFSLNSPSNVVLPPDALDGSLKDSTKVVSYEKSVVAVNNINTYWLQFTQSSNR